MYWSGIYIITPRKSGRFTFEKHNNSWSFLVIVREADELMMLMRMGY